MVAACSFKWLAAVMGPCYGKLTNERLHRLRLRSKAIGHVQPLVAVLRRQDVRLADVEETHDLLRQMVLLNFFLKEPDTIMDERVTDDRDVFVQQNDQAVGVGNAESDFGIPDLFCSVVQALADGVRQRLDGSAIFTMRQQISNQVRTALQRRGMHTVFRHYLLKTLCLVDLDALDLANDRAALEKKVTLLQPKPIRRERVEILSTRIVPAEFKKATIEIQDQRTLAAQSWLDVRVGLERHCNERIVDRFR